MIQPFYRWSCELESTEEYYSLIDHVILTGYLSGYYDDTDEEWCQQFVPPLAVRVLHTQEADRLNWHEEFLDPYWDVDVVDLSHPQLPPVPVRGCWIDGTSYNGETGQIEHRTYRLETRKERWRRRWRRLIRFVLGG